MGSPFNARNKIDLAASSSMLPFCYGLHPGLAKYMRERGAWDVKRDLRVARQVDRRLA